MDTQPPKLSMVGKKIEGVRRIVRINQNTLSERLKMSRPQYYKLLQSGKIDEEMLQKIANALGVSVDAIENYSEEKVLNYIQNNHDHSHAILGNNNHIYPMEKLMEVVEDNKKLYERLLQSAQEQIALLQASLNTKK